MKLTVLKKLLKTMGYTRTGGSPQEHLCAAQIEAHCRALGQEVVRESFPITLYRDAEATLTAGTKCFAASPYFGFAKGGITGELYILHKKIEPYFRGCKDKIVLVEGGMGYTAYEALIQNGARGFICFFGGENDKTRHVDEKRRRFVWDGALLPGVCIHAKDAMTLSRLEGREINLSCNWSETPSHGINLIADVPGQTAEWVTLCAHYDSTPTSRGVYDNLSGAVALLHVLERIKKATPYRGIRFVWTACEELGLVGAEHYCKAHSAELAGVSLCINLDMLGATVGMLTAFSSVNEDTVKLLADFAAQNGRPCDTRLGIRSSDSTVFTDYRVPTVSFARYAPAGIGTVHSPADRLSAVNPITLLEDAEFVYRFTEFAAGADFPAQGEICQKVLEDTEKYFKHKIRA